MSMFKVKKPITETTDQKKTDTDKNVLKTVEQKPAVIVENKPIQEPTIQKTTSEIKKEIPVSKEQTKVKKDSEDLGKSIEKKAKDNKEIEEIKKSLILLEQRMNAMQVQAQTQTELQNIPWDDIKIGIGQYMTLRRSRHTKAKQNQNSSEYRSLLRLQQFYKEKWNEDIKL